MSLAAYEAVWTRSRAKGAMQHLLAVFADFADERGVCWPSISTIADRLQITRRSAERMVAAAVAAGELIPIGRGVRGVVIYRLACLDTGYVGRRPPTKTSGVTPDKNVGGDSATPDKNVGSPPTKTSGAPPTKTSDEPSLEPSLNQVRIEAAAELQAAFALWNDLAETSGLKPVQRLTAVRAEKLAARLTECDGVDGWAIALNKISQTPGMLGQNARGWRCDFDWLLDETHFAKLMECRYDDWGCAAKKPTVVGERERRVFAGLAAAAESVAARRRRGP